MSSNKINLQLGDIIEIISPSDAQLHDKQFIINYIDKSKIIIMNDTGNTNTINIREDGNLNNESILSIILLSRADTPSYAKQNKLLPMQWIDIYFDGDVPAVMTGQITDLDEDQIEVKLITEDIIYIDFAYKGIPENLPIIKIVIRDKPTSTDPSKTPLESEIDTVPELKQSDTDNFEDDTELPQEEGTALPDIQFRERIKDILIDADQIQFGDKLGKVSMTVEVPEGERRYGIERQTNDLLNELLSSIPNAQRSQTVLNNIHKMIERYKQLRNIFSKFDENGNAYMPDIQGSDFKPLVQSLEKLNQKLYWIIPVVKNTKKIYDIDEDLVDIFQDVNNDTLANSRTNETEIIQSFKQGTIPTGQNGYDYLTKRIHEAWTPFNKPSNMDSIISNQKVETNLAAVIDNLDDFYSSQVEQEDIKRKRFVIQQHNVGLNTLETYRIKGGENILKIKKVTPPDDIHIKSFITLPESAVSFSRINLPSTNILIKCNLSSNFLSYWQLLHSKTSVAVESLTDKSPLFNDAYLNRIREYIPNEDKDSYLEYLNKIIPKTRILFEIVNKHMKGHLSIPAVLDYLEPFMIYLKDLSFKQYEEITSFIKDKIQLWKRSYVTKKKEIGVQYRKLPKTPVSQLQLLLKGKRGNGISISQGYKLDSIPLYNYSDSELLQYLNDIDYGRLLNNTISLFSSFLLLPESVPNLLANDKLSEKSKEESNSMTQKKCETKVISKKYITIEELNEDNGQEIKFDKKYDNTYYDVIKEYKSELDLIPDEEHLQYLTSKLQENVGMTPQNAEREAEAMLLGYKPVKDGDYAVLYNDLDGKYKYYIRKNNNWILDNDISSDVTDSNSLFCNLNQKCIFINDRCDAVDKAKMDIEESSVNNTLDETLMYDTEQMNTKIRAMTDNSQSRIDSLISLRNLKFLQYDIKQYAYGLDAKEVMVEKSPYANILTLILSQSDFVKRQNDISKFVSYYTRPAISEEDPWWLYCNTSNVKLLPIFISKLAEVFVKGEDYFSYLQKVMSDQGDLGADGEAVIDKYSGWVISYIDFNTEEGYSEDGFVIRSREVMNADLGNLVATAPSGTIDKFGDEETNIIARVMRSLSRYMGLDTDHLESFVMGETAKLLARSMPSQEDYEKAASAAATKGKKPKDSYEIVYNQTLIIITVSFLLIGIQTSIPSLRTKKTYPGCIKSFSGYPSQGNSDMSGIEYIACVVEGIKSSIKPWNSLKKLNQQKFITKMEGIINKFILPTEMMQEKIRAKYEYDSTVVDEYIPESHDITNWINFLPPLKPINTQLITPPTEEFQKQFINDIKKGNNEQFTKINALRSKIIFISIAIQNSIQKVVTKNIADKDAVLSNNAKVPFLENACCNDSMVDTFSYFSDIEPTIQMHNNIAKDIRAVLEDVVLMSKPPILFDPNDTRIMYPSIPNQFDEITIYNAFIAYCNYNTNTPLTDDLRALCMDKPENYDINDTIQEKISKLKQNGINYDDAMLSQLLYVVNRKNIVNLDIRNISFNAILKIRDRLEMISQTNRKVFPKLFTEKFMDLIDQYDSQKKGDDLPIKREFKNYLSKTTDDMERKLSEFIRKNTNIKVHTDFIDCISNITNFKSTSDGSEIYNMTVFLKNNIERIVNVYPNIIINTVKYDNVKIPSSWNLSEIHQTDLKNHTKDYFKLLTQFYNDDKIKDIMIRFNYECKVITQIAMDTLYIDPIQKDYDVSTLFDDSLIRLLFKFYIVNLFNVLSELLDSDQVPSSIRPPNPMLGATASENPLSSDASLIEIVSGDNKILSEKIAKLITVFLTMTCKDKTTVNINYDELKDKVTRSKEKEKDMIVEFLTEMTDEEREVENMFKNFRIGRWSVGMQKGYRQYEGDTYDKERSDIESRTILESKLNKMDGVTEGLMDMFALEALMEDSVEQDIEREENEIPEWAAEDNNVTDEDYDNEY